MPRTSYTWALRLTSRDGAVSYAEAPMSATGNMHDVEALLTDPDRVAQLVILKMRSYIDAEQELWRVLSTVAQFPSTTPFMYGHQQQCFYLMVCSLRGRGIGDRLYVGNSSDGFTEVGLITRSVRVWAEPRVNGIPSYIGTLYNAGVFNETHSVRRFDRCQSEKVAMPKRAAASLRADCSACASTAGSQTNRRADRQAAGAAGVSPGLPRLWRRAGAASVSTRARIRAGAGLL